MSIDATLSPEQAVNGPVVTFTGRLDALEAPGMRTRLMAAIQAGHRTITADLRDVAFVDSAALAALVSALKAIRERDGELEIVSPRSQDALRVFRLTHFDRVFTMLDPDAK